MLNKKHPFYGLCYVLAEAFYHSWGKENGLRPYRAKHNGVSHWWLQDEHGEIVDLSEGQFSEPFPYEKGKPAGFLTKSPSKRCEKLMKVLDEVRYAK